MATKRFIIKTPAQLRALADLAKETPNSLERMAAVWSANKRKQEETSWDKSFYACFSGTRDKDAAVIHFNSLQLLTHRVPIRYNTALRYCEMNLDQVLN